MGQPAAVEALLIAAASGHHLLMSGPPCVGP
ncbi:ATP-binding protein [Microbacterium halotolerans]